MNQSQIEKKIERIKQELGALGEMRSGSLSRQFASCQKQGCACMNPVNPKKHGPFYQLSYSFEGKSTTRFVRPGYVAKIKKELATYKRFRKLTQDWVALAIALSQMKLAEARQKDKEK